MNIKTLKEQLKKKESIYDKQIAELERRKENHCKYLREQIAKKTRKKSNTKKQNNFNSKNL